MVVALGSWLGWSGRWEEKKPRGEERTDAVSTRQLAWSGERGAVHLSTIAGTNKKGVGPRLTFERFMKATLHVATLSP